VIDARRLTDEELRSAVLDLVQREMGPAALIRFQQIFSKGSGDYAEERHAWLDTLSAGEIVREIEAKRR
jgi:hypothetical protein